MSEFQEAVSELLAAQWDYAEGVFKADHQKARFNFSRRGEALLNVFHLYHSKGLEDVDLGPGQSLERDPRPEWLGPAAGSDDDSGLRP